MQQAQSQQPAAEDGSEGPEQTQGPDPAVQAIATALARLEHLLVAKGVVAPQELAGPSVGIPMHAAQPQGAPPQGAPPQGPPVGG